MLLIKKFKNSPIIVFNIYFLIALLVVDLFIIIIATIITSEILYRKALKPLTPAEIKQAIQNCEEYGLHYRVTKMNPYYEIKKISCVP